MIETVGIAAAIGGNLGTALLCPCCGNEYLHQEDVHIWDHGEDSETCNYVEMVDGKGRAFGEVPVTAVPGNPSPRRSGLCITFTCEGCHPPEHQHPSQKRPPFALDIYQHKGQTIVHWTLPKG